MTPEEHLLVITVFAKQLQLIRTLFEILRSHEIVEAGDFDAFFSLITQHEQASGPLFDTAFAFYLRASKRAGVVTGLENYQETGQVSPE